jgi:hypothetical protein
MVVVLLLLVLLLLVASITFTVEQDSRSPHTVML